MTRALADAAAEAAEAQRQLDVLQQDVAAKRIQGAVRRASTRQKVATARQVRATGMVAVSSIDTLDFCHAVIAVAAMRTLGLPLSTTVNSPIGPLFQSAGLTDNSLFFVSTPRTRTFSVRHTGARHCTR